MNEQKIMHDLRVLYASNKFVEFKKEFYKHIFFLSLENRNKIKSIIKKDEASSIALMKEGERITKGKLL